MIAYSTNISIAREKKTQMVEFWWLICSLMYYGSVNTFDCRRTTRLKKKMYIIFPTLSLHSSFVDYYLGLDSRLIVVLRFYALYYYCCRFWFSPGPRMLVYIFWFVFFFYFFLFFPFFIFFRCFSFRCWLLFRFIYLLFSVFCVFRVLLSPRVVFNIVPFFIIVTKLFFLSFGFFFLFSKIGIKCVFVYVLVVYATMSNKWLSHNWKTACLTIHNLWA